MITENEVNKNCFLLVQSTIIVQSQHATFQARDEQADFRPSSPGVAAASSQQRFSSNIKVQAVEAGKQLLLCFSIILLPVSSIHFKPNPAQLTSKSHKGNVLPVWVAEKRIHKSPSGPNPVGNHNPPSKQ
ncbi:LOW QUALITY PROTEIN: hypothetical protein NC651_002421 [Populus alba x Populus x berolinensis]|nr:LOW QUALITY PROTEIN: hypothetical protein NC651_002421 [Populus alba x Populus x berolinensis]